MEGDKRNISRAQGLIAVSSISCSLEEMSCVSCFTIDRDSTQRAKKGSTRPKPEQINSLPTTLNVVAGMNNPGQPPQVTIL